MKCNPVADGGEADKQARHHRKASAIGKASYAAGTAGAVAGGGSSDVHCPQRTALIGIVEQQNGHSFVVGAAGGGGLVVSL